jgi:hypothetical protein
MDRGAVTVTDQMMLRAGSTAVDRRRTCSGTPFFQRRCDYAYRRSRPVDPVRRVQPGEQYLMHLIDDSRLPPNAPACASTSSPTRSRVPAVSLPSRCRCAARPGLLAGRTGPGAASTPEPSPAELRSARCGASGGRLGDQHAPVAPAYPSFRTARPAHTSAAGLSVLGTRVFSSAPWDVVRRSGGGRGDGGRGRGRGGRVFGPRRWRR